MNKNDLQDAYVTQNLSQRQVATKFGISQTTVRYYLLKYKVVKNTSKKRYSHMNVDKICPKCNVFKLAEDYYHSKKNTDRKAGSWCKLCMKAQVVERQRKYKQQALDYKGSKCQSCGYNKYPGALEFHHRDPSQKDIEMSKFSRSPLSEEGKKELNKCDLLCANCHREIHATQNSTN
jgi:predicted transcriptional regulator